MSWEQNNNHLEKVFKFKNYKQVMTFVNGVADIANQQNHHPQMVVDYNQVVIRMTTHDAGNTITDKDHRLSETIENYYGSINFY